MGTPKDSVKGESLAIHGGVPAVPGGPPAWPIQDEAVLDALRDSWRRGSWGQYHGPHCAQLVDDLATMHGVEHVLLCCSGTYAVEAALRGLGVGQGDEVILAGYDFPGNFRAVEVVAAKPVLVDIARDTWSLDPAGLDAALGPSTRAVIVSHLHGGLVPMPEVMAWASERGVAVVEDACQATGALINGRLAGSYGDAGILSFGGSKLLSAGRGGALLTSREDVFQRAKIYGHRGNDAFPLSELQAAVLIPQLTALASRNARRHRAVQRLLENTGTLSGLVRSVDASDDNSPSFYKLAWLYKGERTGGASREVFAAAMRAEGVALDAGFRGFTGRSQRRCRRAGPLTNSESASASAVLLHHPVLLADDGALDAVAAAFEKVHRRLVG